MRPLIHGMPPRGPEPPIRTIMRRTGLSSLTVCPGCRKTVKPVADASGATCPSCGTRWMSPPPALEVVKGGGQ